MLRRRFMLMLASALDGVFLWMFSHKKILTGRKSLANTGPALEMKAEGEIVLDSNSSASARHVADARTDSEIMLSEQSIAYSADSAVAKSEDSNYIKQKATLVAYKRAAAMYRREIVLVVKKLAIAVKSVILKPLREIIKLSRKSEACVAGCCNTSSESEVEDEGGSLSLISSAEESVADRKINFSNVASASSNKVADVISESTIGISNKAIITFMFPVTFKNYDGAVIHEAYVHSQENCVDPITEGLIESPTRPDTVQWKYGAVIGWSEDPDGEVDENALLNITSGKDLYAIYEKELQQYTARFFDGENLMQESLVGYGQEAVPPDTTKDKHDFLGWVPRSLVVTKDTDFYGEWVACPDLIPMGTYDFSQSTNGFTMYGEDKAQLYVAEKIATKRAAEVNRNYYVYWDGQTYICEARNVSWGWQLAGNTTTISLSNTAVGNSGIIRYIASTSYPLVQYDTLSNDEPFLIGIGTNEAIIYAKDIQSTHTVRVWEDL